MSTWRKSFQRPVCIFLTKEDFKLTGRRFNTVGIDFEVDDSEYADDTAILFESRNDIIVYSPLLIAHFAKFGMEIHVGDHDKPDKPSKTEVLFVAKPPKSYADPVTYDNTNLSNIDLGNRTFFPVVEKFCYLGTFITRDCKDMYDVTIRIKKLETLLGHYARLFFSNKSISYEAKSAAYRSLILPILLYGAETWCLSESIYSHLRTFHHTCIRAMCRINRSQVFQFRISTNDLLERLSLKRIDQYICHRRLSWLGHVARMPFTRLPRKLLSSWVNIRRPREAPEFTYGRGVFKALKVVNVDKLDWFGLALDRDSWKHVIDGI